MKLLRHALLFLVLVAATAFALVTVVPRFAPQLFGGTRTVTNNQVVAAITEEQQVVLLSLGIQGIVSDEANGKIWGMSIPGSGRSKFVQYSYLAKLGVEGGDVKVEDLGAKKYRVSVPEFIFIGHDKEQFKLAVEKGGVMSWTAPDVDTSSLITEVLSEPKKKEHIDTYRDTLEGQARTFYTGIVKGVDPAATVDFVFAGH